MLQFVENKQKKRDLKRSDKAEEKIQNALGEALQVENRGKRPAWVDNYAAKLSVSIDDVSRLRKLKQTEKETHING